VLERRAGDYDLAGCRVIAASNPAESAADGGVLSPAMASRWAHVEWVCDPAAWVAGELSGWGEPRTPARARAAAAVCAYIRAHPTALSPAAPEGVDVRSIACPRSWSAAIALLSSAPATARRVVVAAAVGEAAASEWATYDAARDLPDPEEVLAGRAKLPARGDAAHAASLALAACALAQHPDSSARVRAAWSILATVRPDVALAAGRALSEGAPGEVPDELVALGSRVIRAGGKS
jgi:hypothetical protein